MVDWKKIGMASVGIAGISFGLAWIYKSFLGAGIANISLSAIDVNVKGQITSGVNTSLAGQLLGYLGGIIPSDGWVGTAIYLSVAAFILVLLSTWVRKIIPVGKDESTQFGVALTISAGIVGLVVGQISPSIGAVGTLVAMLIYYGIVSFLYVGLRRVKSLQSILPSV